jgi:UDP-2,3-diacylglucosamine pyrophosphatase LpxH
MSATMLDTLLLSDVHLGSDVSRAQDALDLLQSLSFRRLILLGDIFSDLNFRRLTGEHWRFLSYIRKLSNPKRKIEVVWVEGNHDQGLSKVMSHLVGLPVYQRYAWEYDGKRHLAIHGHQFDRFVSRNLLISRIGEFIYYEIQKFEGNEKSVSRYLDRLNTRWLQLCTKVSSSAISYARLGGVDRIFCGHTHVAMHLEQAGVEYFNTGAWINPTATYIAVDAGGVRIHEYNCRINDRRSGEERGWQSADPVDLAVQPGLSAPTSYQSVRC